MVGEMKQSLAELQPVLEKAMAIWKRAGRFTCHSPRAGFCTFEFMRGVPIGTIMSRVARARKALAEDLEWSAEREA